LLDFLGIIHTAVSAMGNMGRLSLLHRRDVAALSVGQLISDLGDWICYVAVVALVYKLTGSGTALAGLTIIRIVPSIVLAPLAGVLVDRCDRRLIMILSDVLRGLAVLQLALTQDMTMIYIVAVVTAVLSAIFTPARSAILPALVSREELLPANALLSSISNAMLVIGPGVGGALVSVAGVVFGFQFNAVSFFFSAVCIAMVRSPRCGEPSQSQRSVLDDLWQGTAFVVRHRTILPLMLVQALVMLGAGALHILLLAHVGQTPALSEESYAYLLSAMGLGTLVGAALASRVVGALGNETTMGLGVVLMGLAAAALAPVQHVYVLLVLLVLWGSAGSLVYTVQSAMLGLLLPDRMRARGFSTYTMLTSLAAITSAAFAGGMLDRFDAQPLLAATSLPILIAGLLSLAALPPQH
jgi:MFS family permease